MTLQDLVSSGETFGKRFRTVYTPGEWNKSMCSRGPAKADCAFFAS